MNARDIKEILQLAAELPVVDTIEDSIRFKVALGSTEYFVEIKESHQVPNTYLQRLLQYAQLQHSSNAEVLNGSFKEEAASVLQDISPELIGKLNSLAKTDKIQACRELRQQTGCSLLLAKCIVETEI